MDFSTAEQIITALAALSGMINTFMRFRAEKEKSGKLVKDVQLQKEELKAIADAGDVETRIDPKEIYFLQKLPRDIGDAAKTKIDRILKRYSDAINSPISVFELDKESEIAEFEICHTLRLIKKHNGGKLPNKYLRDLWEAFNCDKQDH